MHIAKITSKVLAQSALIAVLAGTAMFFILKNLTNDPAPALDATAMTLSIIAAWWLAKAYIYQFFLWIVANSFSIILFGSQGKWFAVALYCVYIVVSFFGYFNWKKKAVVHG